MLQVAGLSSPDDIFGAVVSPHQPPSAGRLKIIARFHNGSNLPWGSWSTQRINWKVVMTALDEKLIPGTSGVVGEVTRHYGQFVTSGESFLGIWEEEQGLAFIDRTWLQTSRWQAPLGEVEGFYNFYIQGKAHLQCGEFNGLPTRSTCRPGSVQLMKPDDTVHTAGLGQTRIFQISLSPSYLAEYLGRCFVMPAGLDLDTRQLDDIGLATLARAHQDAMWYGLTMRQLYFDQLREAMVRRIVSVYSVGRGGAEKRIETLVPATTRTVIDYIEGNLSHDLRLAALSKVAGLSRAHFARSFQQVLGMSPHRYVQHRRLNLAMALLRQSLRTTSEIAALTGFADAAHLARAFRLKFGFTPSRIR
jgi:AraC family transcriptional regulator